MAKQWQTFVGKFRDMKEGEIKIFIKDLTPGPRKYDTKFVRAIVKRAKESLPDGDILYIRSESGLKSPEPWYIKIIEELQEYVPGKPWKDVFQAIEKIENKN